LLNCDIFVMCLAPFTFASVFYSVVLEPCVYILFYFTHIFECRMLDLVDISMPNHFVLIVSCLLKPSHLKTSTLFILEVIAINHQKGGD